MDKVIVVCASSPGKTIPIDKLREIAPMVVVDSDDYTKAEVPTLEDRRYDITFEIRKQEEFEIKSPPVNPFANGMLRKRKKGKFKRF